MSKCVTCWYDDYDDGPRPNPHCPACGKFLKWNESDREYTCKCNRIICLPGTGDPEEDAELLEHGICSKEDLPFRICVIS